MNSVIKKTTTIETTYDESGKTISKKETIIEEKIKNDNMINIPNIYPTNPLTTTPWITTTYNN